MTPKEEKLMDYTLSAIESIHQAIQQADVRPLANALRKLTAMQILIEAREAHRDERGTLDLPVRPIIEKATPEDPPLDIADQIPLEPVREAEAKKKNGNRLSEQQIQQILYLRAQKMAAASVAEKVGCSPQTVLNIENRNKKNRITKLDAQAHFGAGADGGRSQKNGTQ